MSESEEPEGTYTKPLPAKCQWADWNIFERWLKPTIDKAPPGSSP
jgi:hypothetical protein